MNDEDKSAASGELRYCQNQFQFYSLYAPGEVAGPGEAEEGDGGEVVDEHLPKVFSLHIEKLQDRQGPVESQLKNAFHRPSLKVKTLSDKIQILTLGVCQPETCSTTRLVAPQDDVDTPA